MAEPSDIWNSLSEPWRIAFEQAWIAFGEGNFGIGACIADDAGEIRAVGRNQVATPRPGPLPLAGNYLAHAEMNALASLDEFSARGFTMYTTLEPCLMCAAASLFMNIERVEYATRDEFFEPFDEVLWPHHPYTRTRAPESVQAITGKLSSFARVLPLVFTFHERPRGVADVATQRRPALSELARSGEMVQLRADAAEGLGLFAALDRIWGRLPTAG